MAYLWNKFSFVFAALLFGSLTIDAFSCDNLSHGNLWSTKWLIIPIDSCDIGVGKVSILFDSFNSTTGIRIVQINRRNWKVSGENTHHGNADFHSQLGLWIDSDRSRVSCRLSRRHLFAICYSHMATIALSPSMNFISMSRHLRNVENSHFAVGLTHAFEFNFFASYVRSESKSLAKSQSHFTVSANENIDPFAIS